MEDYNVSDLCKIIASLAALETVIKALRVKHGERFVDTDFRKALANDEIEKALNASAEITFMDCTSHITRLADALKKDDLTPGMAEVELRHAKEDILTQVSKWRFVPIKPDLSKYFEQPKLFGLAVFETFEAARNDVKEAGNCIAADCPTAAVFHLMRVAEHGLRALANKLRVRLFHKGRTHPIELADWEQVVDSIKNKIAAVRKVPRSAKRLAQLELYSDAGDHCTFMKDIWRNNVSHSRRPYTLQEALSTTERVADFMRFTAEKVLG